MIHVVILLWSVRQTEIIILLEHYPVQLTKGYKSSFMFPMFIAIYNLSLFFLSLSLFFYPLSLFFFVIITFIIIIFIYFRKRCVNPPGLVYGIYIPLVFILIASILVIVLLKNDWSRDKTLFRYTGDLENCEN